MPQIVYTLPPFIGKSFACIHVNWCDVVNNNNCDQGYSNKPCRGNTHHVFDGAKLFISDTRPSPRTSRTRLEDAWSSSAVSQMTSDRNKQFCPVKNMVHITVTGFDLSGGPLRDRVRPERWSAAWQGLFFYCSISILVLERSVQCLTVFVYKYKDLGIVTWVSLCLDLVE